MLLVFYITPVNLTITLIVIQIPCVPEKILLFLLFQSPMPVVVVPAPVQAQQEGVHRVPEDLGRPPDEGHNGVRTQQP